MFRDEPARMNVYLFTREGRPILAAPAGERLPMEPSQVEGILALAGEFPADPAGTAPAVVRARYDGYGILGLRGERSVVATVWQGAPETVLLPELERFLRRCDRRLRREGSE